MKKIMSLMEEWLLVVLILALLVPLIYFTIDDIVYFNTKIETTAEVVREELSRTKEDSFIDVKYYDKYEHKYVVSRIMDITPETFKEKEVPYSSRIKIFYSKAANLVYVKGVNELKFGVVIIYIMNLIILPLGLFFGIRNIRKKQSKIE